MAIEVAEDRQAIQTSVRELARAKIAPRAAEIDLSAEFPRDVVEMFRRHDVFAIAFTPEYGGLSGSALTLAIAVEEIAKVCATSALLLAVQGLGGYPILLGGSDEQKREFLPELASGNKIAAYALS
ncbi:MAG TPA: acyl-CoA dehydrogenase family protein, partial [Candidatus Saccharimonadales bacterium]|nr:acyl-CoA dehydrogenase family protein [Candidatus Saccharimonadales bacterium]